MAKIMLVEDDNNLREIYEARLLAEGYEIVSAKDGEEALALAVKEKPDLIISDVMMPKISGFDMLDILRSTPETKNTKVIMMTALSQAEDKARADKLGADRYLVKSQVTLEDVAKVAREVLNNDTPGGIPTVAAVPAPVAAEPAPAPEPVAVAPAPVPVPDPTPAPQPVTAAPEPPVAAAAPAPAPEPTPPAPASADPVIAPAPAPEPTTVGVTPPADTSVTTAEEEAAIDAQIDAFVAKVAPDGPAPAGNTAVGAAPAPAPVASEPAVTQVPAADAIAPTPTTPATVTPTATAAPAPTTPDADAPTQPTTGSAANRRIIEPIGDPTVKPDLDALLAKEEAKEMAQQAGQSVINQADKNDPSNLAL